MAGFFNTNWDTGNSFNSPYGSNQQQNIFGTNPMDQGRYVGNPNHIAQQQLGGGGGVVGGQFRPPPTTWARPPSELTDPNSPTYKTGLEEQWLGLNQGGVPNTREGVGKDGRPLPAVPEYMKGFNPSGQHTMDSRMYTLDGKQMTGGSSYIAALRKHLESIGQGNLLDGGTYTPSTLTTPPVNLWGAPTGYDPSQQQNIFNPYSLGNNQYYNPYSFGGINTGTQGGTGEVPWWQNYNTGGTGVTPPTVTPPTTPTQPTGNGGGGGGQGKDLTYAETIKEMGLYPNAEKAFEAGDNQAAYRQDHMQWRSGTGAWAGNGKKAGESDGDYPGRTVGNNVIKGDKQRMAELMGLGNLFMGNGNGMLKRTPNDRSGNDYTVAGDGTFVTPGGTTVETQLTRDSNLAAQEAFQGFNSDMLRRGNRLPFGENTNIFGPAAPNGEQLSQTMVAQDDSGMFSISDIPSYSPYSNIRGGDRSGSAPATQYEAGPAEMTIAEVNALAGYNKGFGSGGQARYEAGRAETSAARVAAEKQAAEQAQANIFMQNQVAEQRARETAQKARADRAAQDRQDAARRAQAQAQDKAQAQAKAAADAKRAKEAANAAAAARQRQNNNYSTGPVAPRPSTGTGGSSSGRGSRAGRTAPAAPKAPKKTTTTRRYTGRYGL
tara:strand:+ start:261 stop:2237 length:1977 start_codon:yes stop_codon:yes gene_type:complete